MSPSDVFDEAYRIMSGRLVWGVSDCCTSASDVFLSLWGVDPMPNLRGKFSSPEEALRAVRGDLLSGFRQEVLSAGLVQSEEDAGMIGILDHSSHFRYIVGVCVRPGEWVARYEYGLGVLQSRSLEAFGCRL